MYDVKRNRKLLRLVDSLGEAMTVALQLALQCNGPHDVRVYKGNQCVFRAKAGKTHLVFAGSDRWHNKVKWTTVDGKRVI